MKRHILHILTLLFLLLATGPTAWTQGYYTITNGHYYWFDGSVTDPDDGKYLTAWDKANGWKGIYRLGTHATANVTEIVEQGDFYLALNLDDPENPKVEPISTDVGFSPLCVWFRTGATGYYYQEWDNYRYYLYSSHSDDASINDLSIYKVEVGQPLEKKRSWYDWDYGCATQEEVDIPGGKKTSYFWLILDNLNDADPETQIAPVWRMSKVSCYQRPEEMILNNYIAVGNSDNTWDNATAPDKGISYYDNVRVGQLNYPAGIGATFMPVNVIEHAKTIVSADASHGLRHLRFAPFTLNGNDYTNVDNGDDQELEYGGTDEIDVRAYIKLTNLLGEEVYQMNIRPAYTEYVEETYRRGINLNYVQRTDDEFGKSGVPTVRHWYFYANNVGDPITNHNNPPSSTVEYARVDSVRFDFNPQAKRFMEIDSNSTPTRRSNYRNNHQVTIRVFDPPISQVSVFLTATVFYHNGVIESHTDTILVKHKKSTVALTSHKGPSIQGSVFGGGKMADVTGNTHVTVHSADSIYAVYGGNDIAGWVKGDKGATVQIGTTQTTEEHPVRIGWVYGGGCGYYSYQNVCTYNFESNVATWNTLVNDGLSSTQLVFNGNVYPWNTKDADLTGANPVEPVATGFTYDANETTMMDGTGGNGTIPYVKKTQVTIGVPEVKGHSDSLGHNAHEHNDHILIDSLFGGAENAFIGVTAANPVTASSVDINGGTILAVFGGNNYGGALAKTSKTYLTVNCTKLTDDAHYKDNTYFRGSGRDYGIRNLFGGGNEVPSSHATVTFNGGQVDTAFVGGNSATVDNPEGIVEALRDGVVYDYHGFAETDDEFTKPFMNGHFIYTNYTLTDTSHAGLRDWTKNSGYTPDYGLYNVRFLFGGNNRDKMDNVSFLKLHSGGICGVYGGGNMGDMNNDKTLYEAWDEHKAYVDISPLLTTLDSILNLSSLISKPNKISSVVAAKEGSQIIAEYVHGGCRRANVKNSCGVYLAGGSYFDVFTGNDVSGDIGSENDGATYCVITGDAVVHANVYGGSDGYYHCEARDKNGVLNSRYADGGLGMDQFNAEFDYDPFGEMVGLLLPTLQHTNVFVHGGLIKGDLVAGGVMANVGYSMDAQYGDSILRFDSQEEEKMSVTKQAGTVRLEVAGNAEIHGNVFGGGAFASVYGLSQVLVRESPTILGSLYAGNDALGQVKSYLPFMGNLDKDTQKRSYFRYYYDNNLHEGATIDRLPASVHQDQVDYMNRNMTDEQKTAAQYYYYYYDHHCFEHGSIPIATTDSLSYQNDHMTDEQKTAAIAYYQTNPENLNKDTHARSYFSYYYGNNLHGGITIPALPSTLHQDSVAYMNAHPMSAEQKTTAETYYKKTEKSSNGDYLNYPVDENDETKGYNPKYSTYVLIQDSPIINSVYGSGNGAWDYDGTRPQFPATYVCPGRESDVPDQEGVYIDINTSGGFIDTVFGGGNGCTVTEGFPAVVLLNNTKEDNENYPYQIETDPKFARFVGGTSRSELTGTNFVGTIFGGNNFSDMVVVPEIKLDKGNVKNIYGGGNEGNMKGTTTKYDICGNAVKEVSTHVLSESDKITVTDSVFGGCRMSNIDGTAFVEVCKTSGDGIHILYGGNDISGIVGGNTRIDMSGGTVNRIYGGSNGQYDYVPIGYDEYNVYHYGQYDPLHPDRGIITTAGRPDVDSTHINLWGGDLSLSVFAGGSMADTRSTCLVVDDQIEGKESCPISQLSKGVTVNGTLFGGGEGRWDDLNARDLEGNRWGNVTGTTHVHLYHADNVTSAMAYGGGGGGDVQNTFVKTYDTWDSPFLALFGGCWGSEVFGTAHLEFNGVDLVKNLFGGNDFTGNVYNTEIVVNSGRFFNVFGGGNGDYPDSYYKSQYAYGTILGPGTPYAYIGAKDNVYDNRKNKNIDRPNSEYVHITFNDGTVDSCLYGGGKMGTILPYIKNSSGEYDYYMADTNNDGTGDLPRYQPDTTRTIATTVADPTDLAYTVLNIHGGQFKRNVFAGGRGFKGDKKPIVYGVKVVNMDGGEVYESLYGGSEFINDGYPAECDVPRDNEGHAITNPTQQQRIAATTQRPSSIVNLTGGTVGSNLYGAGYQGLVYGSTYVNIGEKAIDSCTVWENSYGTDTQDSTYKRFKPGYSGGLSEALTANTISLHSSVYSGANWGNASGSTTFDNPGFFGGESRLYVDGEGYNTSNDFVTSDPEMNLMRSIYGSGTSVLGGDLHSQIEVRNYGSIDGCHPTKTLETIQRTDSLWLHNTAITFKGTTDASQQYMSNRYSLKNIGYWNYRGYNVSELQAAVSDVENLAFYEQSSNSNERHTSDFFERPYIEVPVQELNIQINGDACGDDAEICDKEYMVNPNVDTKRHTLLILDNGVDLTIGKGKPNSTDIDYGSVTGFGFVTTPKGFQSSITARPKMELPNHNENDDGFVTTCNTSNRYRTPATSYDHVNTDWTDENAAYNAADELKYTNHATAVTMGFEGKKYREWKVGDKEGLRETEATLLAHSNPYKLQQQDRSVEITSGTYPYTAAQKYGIAEAVFELPATTAGHYYQLMDEGFVITGSNGAIEFVDSAWHPKLTNDLALGNNVNMSRALSNNIGNWFDRNANHPTVPDTKGEWSHIPGGVDGQMSGSKNIHKKPEYTFGLIMVPNTNFQTKEVEGTAHYDMPASIDHDRNSGTPNETPTEAWARFIVNGNARTNSFESYCSPKVYDEHDESNPELKPSMRLYLTYDTTFTTTFNGNVKFKMMEYDEQGHEVAPILVTVYIQTIIDELKSIKQDVLAMYNGGRTNTFTRKLELVPCGEERNLYITDIRWMPTDNNGNALNATACTTAFGNSDLFSLLGDSSLVWDDGDASYPHEVPTNHTSGDGSPNHSSHNRFSMSLIPSNNVSEDAIMANGWIRGTGKRTNVYKLADPIGNGTLSTPVKTLQWDSQNDSVGKVSLKSESNPLGYFVGTLDGRGSAMLDVELTFDGTRLYDKIGGKGYVGKVILTMETFADDDANQSRGTFDVTIYVKTRANGDTIYIASADYVTRQVSPNKSITVYPYSNSTENPPATYTKEDIGKYPHLYVQSFRKALEDGIYQEGDVLCIIDQVHINTEPVHITGANGSPIEVIRYDGHHHDLPDEQSVYRGPMIVVSNGMSFTARTILFHGGAGAQIKHIDRGTDANGNPIYDYNTEPVGSGNLQFRNYTYSGKTIDKLPDTNIAFAPIIQVTGTGSTVNLREGTIVEHNWNGYGSAAGQTDANGMPTETKNMGAISVTNGATLTFNGNVTVENNFSHTLRTHDHLTVRDSISVQRAPGGAAIYVDGGTMELTESNRNTAVTITKNYLMDTLVHTHPELVTWWVVNEVEGVPVRFSINTNTLKTWDKANVLLTRKANTTQTGYYFQAMNDAQSDLIVISGTVGDDTKIGVRKWFPGIHDRDTIRFATVTGGNNSILSTSVTQNKNFESDDDLRVFYNSKVNLTTAYLFRCASFRHQYVAAEDGYVGPVYNYSDGNTQLHSLRLQSDNVLHFGEKYNLCPTGGDSIIYRVQGGLMPYTYTWSDPDKTVILQKTITPYSNTQVQHDLTNSTLENAARYAKYAASMADTLLLPNEAMSAGENSKWNHLRVTATDATGECQLYKDIDLRILINHNTTNAVTYWPKASTLADTSSHRDNSSPWRNDTVGTGWTDTNHTVHAVVSRNFKGVQITPRVWVDRSVGNISAVLEGSKDDYVYQWTVSAEGDTVHELTGVNLCPGDTLYLYTEPRSNTTPKPEFIMWDFDPYYKQLARYVVPPHDATVTAYYGPGGNIKYWYQHINSEAAASAIYDPNFYYTVRDGHNYVTTYNDDVHIYNEDGLAWLISVINGLNGQQSRQFRFNTVYLHKKDDGTAYDMKDYLWTPMGTLHQPFRGRLIGVDNDNDATTTPLANNDKVIIKNIIINEPYMDYTGFFGHIDSASISGIKIESALIRGSQYVGGLAANSKTSNIDNVAVADDEEDTEGSGVNTTTILSTHYTSGGLLGLSNHDILNNFSSEAKYVGDAVYSGGAVGYGTSTEITNSQTRNDSRMSGLFIGGIAGYLDGTAPVTSGFLRRKTAGEPSIVMNNYVRLESNSGLRVGGIVGYARNSILENNYFYGDAANATVSTGVAAIMEGGSADGNYYQEGAAKKSVNSLRSGATMEDTATFAGQGNQVMLSESVDGRNNLTRVLNAWVRDHNADGGNFFTWRSDLEGVNSGYPLFGQPDMIPVVSVSNIEGCDEVTLGGITYSRDTVITAHVIDSVEMVDSTITAYIRLHYGTITHLTDSARMADGYEGYGFSITPEELQLLNLSIDEHGEATLVLTDTLTTAFGCDSVVTLAITFTGGTQVPEMPEVQTVSPIRVYPNPTVNVVHVEAEEMSHVEVYDNEGRRLQDYDTYGSAKITIDMTQYVTGIYYLRVHRPNNVVIQKIIKQR